MKKKLLLSLIIISLFLLASCSRGSPTYKKNTETERFYQGSEGVRMTILPQTPPPRVYYYSDSADEYNSFNIDVELHNVGTSYTKGGLYVSGYDPSLIYVEGINIPKTSAGFFDNCRMGLNVRELAWNAIGGALNCNLGDAGFELGGDSETGQWFDSVSVNNLFQLFGWEDGPEIDFSWDRSTDQYNFGLDFSKLTLDMDLLHHGKALLIILDALKFDRFNGEVFMLEPDNYDFPGGASEIISFPARVLDTWPAGLDQTDVTFAVTSCYAYATYATPIICVDPDPFSQNEKVCDSNNVQMRSSQGAPVAVTKVYQENTPRSIIFTIEIQNVGNGKIIYPGDLELCSPYYPGRLGIQSLDSVILGDVRLSGSNQRLKCTPDDNIVKLRDGRGTITCKYDLEYATAKSAYKAPLVIEFWYGYSQTEKRHVLVKRVS